MSEDSNPSRQAYSNTSTNGYKGRFVGNICNMISAFYFAKPFAFKGVSPTVKQEDLNK